jgi:trehalose 6-phosphate phosphatase
VDVQLSRAEQDLDSFFARLTAARRRALLLDYDGTLAPFCVERDQARPYPGVRPTLRALMLAGRTRVVIISGRSLVELERLLGLAPAPELWGSHGWERKLAGGSYHSPALGEQAENGLQAAADAVLAHGIAAALERKPAGLALHWRGLAPRAASTLRAELQEIWAPIAHHSGLSIHLFDGGMELRVPGRDKGTAVQTLLDELGPDASVSYLGDDITDEDAFAALGDQGLSVLVRPELRQSAATVWLRPPEELLAFLRRWARVDGAPI